MKKEILYQDSLVIIDDNSITLKKYYYPSLSSKKILFSDIIKIKAFEPTILNGKWRISGTGDFRTWFPWDSARPKRDKIFKIFYKNKIWVRSGFTVENSKKVEEILHTKGLLLP